MKELVTSRMIAGLVVLCLGTTFCWGQNYLSPCDLVFAKDRQEIHTIGATSQQLMTVDLQRREVKRVVDLPSEPTGMVMTEDARTLYITGGGHEGRIWKVLDGVIREEFLAGHTPMSPVLSPMNGGFTSATVSTTKFPLLT